jgi:NAD(P)-dependent dehydrogenase (short-subunit alcohol dehydrogenase family)
MGRLAQPEEVASAVLWLSDENNSYVTGQAIAVDGAWTAR